MAIGAGFNAVEEIGDIVFAVESGEFGFRDVFVFEFAEVRIIDGDLTIGGLVVDYFADHEEFLDGEVGVEFGEVGADGGEEGAGSWALGFDGDDVVFFVGSDEGTATV